MSRWLAMGAPSTAITAHLMVQRLKKTMIVALARKLLVALWKYINAGVVHRGSDRDGCLMRYTQRILPSSRT
ncbi:hypothetical protein X736_33200 [Mesorhizobium sp. L2C089B000]|nr:hypothetical protein X736_33200 [Mesorhizobium sp. L2C089B000]